MSYETKQQEISKEMQDLNARLENFTKSKEYSKEYSKGYSDCQKEYEEKLRWIPVEERLPENQELVLVKTNRNCVSTAYLHGKISGFITYGEEAFVDFGSITHWRSIFL